MKRDYPRQDITAFGHYLVNTGDLDPIYIALTKLDDPALIKRWCVAYWCLYHAGASSWLAEHTGRDFWLQLDRAAWNVAPAPTGGRWPRGHERRHWRAKNATAAVAHLSQHFPNPEDYVDFLSDNEAGGPFAAVSLRARSVPSNGPWIAFKIGDMLERCLGIPIDFSQAEVFMFDTPREAAFMLWRKWSGLPDFAKPKEPEAIITRAVAFLKNELAGLTAPPFHDRELGLQEIETVLCKWKSHMGGHYPLNNDIREISEGLLPWVQHSTVAATFLHHMPKERITHE